MTDLIPLSDDEGDEDAERRRSLWGLAIIAALAVIVVAVFSVVIGESGDSHGQHNASPNDLITNVTGGASDVPAPTSSLPAATPSVRASTSAKPKPQPKPPASAHVTKSASPSATPSPSPTASKTPSSTPTPSHTSSPPAKTTTPSPPSNGICPSQQICALNSIGNTVTEVNDYRIDEGLDTALGESSQDAVECAVSKGDSCRTPASLTIESSLSGTQAVHDIAEEPGNFLLDPQMQSFEVGWAYDPATGRYYCAILEN